MKRRILSLLLTLALFIGVSVPALAADEGLIPLPKGVNGFGTHYFHNGLVPVLAENGWSYVNTKGELMPNSYCHTFNFDYSEGYAAFADLIGDYPKVGYMDAAGKVVVPAQYDLYEFSFGEVGAGRVIGGQALVYNAADNSWAQINMKGQKVKRTLDPSDDNVIYSDYRGNTDGVTFEAVTIDGEETELGFSEGYALSFEYIVKQGYVPEKKEPITFQFDNDYYETETGPINDITFTNNTDERITGAFSLLIYNPKAYCYKCRYGYEDEHRDDITAHLYPVDIDLAPGESMTKTAYFAATYNMTHMKYVWVEYDDAAEREQYLNKKGAAPDPRVDWAKQYGYLANWYLDADYLAQYPYNITFAPIHHK